MGGGAWVVALGHQRHVTILHRHGFIEGAVVGVDALEGEALWRVDAVIIGFLQQRLMRKIVLIVLVRRIG